MSHSWRRHSDFFHSSRPKLDLRRNSVYTLWRYVQVGIQNQSGWKQYHRYNRRIVPKGYSQIDWILLRESFAPIAQVESIATQCPVQPRISVV